MIQEATLERPTFAAGEISPRLRWRRDLAKAQTGVDKLENMIVLVEGGAMRRSGTRFVLPLKNEAERAGKLKFELDRTDSFLLVFNGGKARFLRGGGYIEATSGDPYEIDIPWAAADVGNLRGAQDGNAVYLACSGYRPRVLTRLEQTNWQLTDYPVTPVDTQNLDITRTLQASAATGVVDLVATGAGTFDPGDIGTVWRIDEPDLTIVPLWKSAETGIGALAERRYNGNVYRAISGTDAGPNPPTHTEGSVKAGDGNVVWEFRHKGFGLVRIDTVTGGTTATGTVLSRLPDSVVSNPTYRWFPSAWSELKGWPEQVVIHQNRLCWFRGSDHWISQPFAFQSFDVTGGAVDAIVGRLKPQDGSLALAEWAIASGALIVGTRGGEWVFGTSTQDRALTATNIDPFQDGSEGSGPHVPALVDGGAIFIGRSRQRLHFMRFDREATALSIDEVTLACRHILKSKASAVAYQRDPHRLLWVATESGQLIAFTFMPKEQVIAGHRHPLTNGFVEDLAVIPSTDGTANDLYLFMRRTIDGATRRYIEILEPFFEPLDAAAPTAEGAWFVDCGLRYAGAPATVITGLDHIEGETVKVHADGAMHPPLVVAGGQVTLNRAASDVVIGLAVPYRLKTLPFETETRKGSSKGMAKRSNIAHVDVVESAGGTIAINGGRAENLVETGAVDYGAPVALATRSIEARAESMPGPELTLDIAGDDTMPMTIAGVTPEADILGA
jgi:hypothetical protein